MCLRLSSTPKGKKGPYTSFRQNIDLLNNKGKFTEIILGIYDVDHIPFSAILAPNFHCL